MRVLVGILLVAGCQSASTTGAAPTSLPIAGLRAAIGDLDGDHRNELVVSDAKTLTVRDRSGRVLASLPLDRGISQLVVSDIDGDGRSEIYVGWSQTRDHMETKAGLSVVRFSDKALSEQRITELSTERNEVVAIVPEPDTKSLLLSYFDSKYMVTTIELASPSWTAKPVFQIRMATSLARGDVDGDGTPDLAVGRVYGDAMGDQGDAFVLRGSSRVAIPSTRGMRSIAVIDGAVYMGDGWHQNYAANARGLLSRARIAGGAFVTNTIEDTPGQYAVEQIIPATVENHRVIVTRGTKVVRAFRPNGDKWEAATLGGLARDVAAGDLDGKPGDEILILGDKNAEIVNLAGATWSPIP